MNVALRPFPFGQLPSAGPTVRVEMTPLGATVAMMLTHVVRAAKASRLREQRRQRAGK